MRHFSVLHWVKKKKIRFFIFYFIFWRSRKITYLNALVYALCVGVYGQWFPDNWDLDFSLFDKKITKANFTNHEKKNVHMDICTWAFASCFPKSQRFCVHKKGPLPQDTTKAKGMRATTITKKTKKLKKNHCQKLNENERINWL